MMSKLLEKSIEKLRELPSDRQDDAAELLLSMVLHEPDSIRLSDDQVAEVERRLKEPSQYGTHSEVEAFFKKLNAWGLGGNSPLLATSPPYSTPPKGANPCQIVHRLGCVSRSNIAR